MSLPILAIEESIMGNMMFSSGNATLATITFPSASSDCGKVLYALYKYGAQTRDELYASSGCCGVTPRICNLRHDYFWPIYTVMEPFTRLDGRTVDIARYHINWHLVDVNSPAFEAFIATCSALHDRE